MKLRAKLTWAFVLVVLLTLIPALMMLNMGAWRSAHMGPGPRFGMGHMMGAPPRTPPATTEAEEARQNYMLMVRVWSGWAGLAALALAGATGWFTAGRITRSLRHLRDAAHHLDLRDLSRRVPVEGKDEIAELAATFNLMSERLEAEERSRRQLLADVAHELRHPLAVMKGRLDLMQEGKVPVDDEALLPLQDEVIRLTRLVGDLRDLSLAEVGGLSLHLAPLEMGALLDTLLVNLEPVAAAKEIRLTADVAPDLPPVQADPDRIRQVLVNLLSNALQYTPEGGSVTVTAGAANRAVTVSIADTGPGIAPEDLPHVFNRFYRADKSRSRATGGSGLGLAIVRSLVELHQGQITVESEPGRGTCFTVTLPAAKGGPA
ncbi:MAG TPA: HAMP domain-containing sensor histidine kinase [Symbiobacteriaceae bacterium]|nr:HAMP domain-containing sensor histidine kinase [Symbiobacteriaceae bacterium]